MSFNLVPVYKCDVCGKRMPARYNCFDYVLPADWKGSMDENGFCFCPECYQAFSYAKKRAKEAEKDA